MTDSSKSKLPKPINDVSKPGEKAPSGTSRSIITHKPMMQDPMVLDPDNGSEIESKASNPSSGGEKVIPASSEAAKVELKPDDTVAELAVKAKVKKEEEAKKTATESSESADSDKQFDDKDDQKADKSDTSETESSDGKTKSDQPDSDAEETKKAEHDANIQKIIDSKKFELPITTSEKRRSARFVALGILLAVLLALVWVDIALDAGLVDIPGIQPVTHLFSN